MASAHTHALCGRPNIRPCWTDLGAHGLQMCTEVCFSCWLFRRLIFSCCCAGCGSQKCMLESPITPISSVPAVTGVRPHTCLCRRPKNTTFCTLLIAYGPKIFIEALSYLQNTKKTSRGAIRTADWKNSEIEEIREFFFSR